MSSLPSLAVVGCGSWGKNWVRTCHQENCLFALSDIHAENASGLAEKYSVHALSFEDIVSHPDIQGVVLATPAVDHGWMALKCLESGKHVMVEKPLALTLEDAKAVVDLAKRRGLVAMVGHLMRYHSAFEALQNNIHRAGKIYHIASHRLNLGTIRTEENVFWSFAPHDISMILALTEEEPSVVEAFGVDHIQQKTEDVTLTGLKFPSGISAHVYVSWIHPFKEQKLVVSGDKGMFVLDDRAENKLVFYHHQITSQDKRYQTKRAMPEPVNFDNKEPLKKECQHFISCIQGNKIPLTDAEEGLRVLRVLVKCQEAMEKS